MSRAISNMGRCRPTPAATRTEPNQKAPALRRSPNMKLRFISGFHANGSGMAYGTYALLPRQDDQTRFDGMHERRHEGLHGRANARSRDEIIWKESPRPSSAPAQT